MAVSHAVHTMMYSIAMICIRDFYKGLLYRYFDVIILFAVFNVFFLLCQIFRLMFEFVLRQLVLTFGPSVLGRGDGSIRTSRKRRSRDKTDNFIE